MVDIFGKTSEGIENASKSSSQLKHTTRIRRPRPFYEINNILRPYNDFHAFWMTILPQIQKNLQLQKLYDVFQIKEDLRLIEYSAANNQRLYEQVTSIFVITKQNLIEIKSIAKMRQQLPEETKEPNLEENTPAEQAPALQPVSVKKKVHKEYDIKHIEFVEIAGEESNVLIFGFRQNQNNQRKTDRLDQLNRNLEQLYGENEDSANASKFVCDAELDLHETAGVPNAAFNLNPDTTTYDQALYKRPSRLAKDPKSQQLRPSGDERGEPEHTEVESALSSIGGRSSSPNSASEQSQPLQHSRGSNFRSTVVNSKHFSNSDRSTLARKLASQTLTEKMTPN